MTCENCKFFCGGVCIYPSKETEKSIKEQLKDCPFLYNRKKENR